METNKRISPNRVFIKNEDVISVIKATLASCYGVVDIADKSLVTLSYLPKKGTKEEAIFIKGNPNIFFYVDVYLVLSVNVKITETLNECQKVLKFNLDKVFKNCKKVNVYAFSLSK